MTTWNETCAAMHLGPWLIEPDFMRQAVAAIQAGVWRPRANTIVAERDADGRPVELYAIERGIATVPIAGPMMKGDSKFGGASTLRVRRALAAASRDKRVSGIMLSIDSPGGTVAGTDELAAAVREANLRRPLAAHIQDTGASAAYWVASQAPRVTANRMASIGSIGVFAVVEDTSQAAELSGVKVHVVSTGPHKGVGVDGAPVTEEQLGEVRRRIEEINDVFISSVASGRQVAEATVREGWADGRTWGAGTARDLGLVDEVATFEEAVTELRKDVSRRNRRDRIEAAKKK